MLNTPLPRYIGTVLTTRGKVVVFIANAVIFGLPTYIAWHFIAKYW